MMPATFTLRAGPDRPAIRCLLCGSVSELPADVRERYCGRCHLFHDAVTAGRQLHADGGAHDCHEWRTWIGRCAICETVIGLTTSTTPQPGGTEP